MPWWAWLIAYLLVVILILLFMAGATHRVNRPEMAAKKGDRSVRYRKLAGVITCLALVTGLAVPAGALEAPQVQSQTAHSLILPGVGEINPASVSFGWYITIRWSKWEVRRLVNKHGWLYPGATAVAVGTCGLIGSWSAASLCRLAVVGVAWTVWNTFSTAARNGQCVKLLLSYGFPTVKGLVRYSC